MRLVVEFQYFAEFKSRTERSICRLWLRDSTNFALEKLKQKY